MWPGNTPVGNYPALGLQDIGNVAEVVGPLRRAASTGAADLVVIVKDGLSQIRARVAARPNPLSSGFFGGVNNQSVSLC